MIAEKALCPGRVMVLGSTGMVGSAVVEKLKDVSGVDKIIPVNREHLDLTNQAATFRFLERHKPDFLILAAAKVGGIGGNSSFPKEYLYQNLSIELNAFEAAYRAGVQKLIFLGSSCVYSPTAEQPISEECLMRGDLDRLTEPYAIAKLAGIKMCESYNRQCQTDYRALIPTNLYGPRDNYDPLNSHVVASLIRRFHVAKLERAKRVSVWGTGSARREFLYVNDLADAICYIMTVPADKYYYDRGDRSAHLNVGSGYDVSIEILSEHIKKVVGLKAEIIFDYSRPEGAKRKLLDSSKIMNLGWAPKTPLEDGLSLAYSAFKKSSC